MLDGFWMDSRRILARYLGRDGGTIDSCIARLRHMCLLKAGELRVPFGGQRTQRGRVGRGRDVREQRDAGLTRRLVLRTP